MMELESAKMVIRSLAGKRPGYWCSVNGLWKEASILAAAGVIERESGSDRFRVPIIHNKYFYTGFLEGVEGKKEDGRRDFVELKFTGQYWYSRKGAKRFTSVGDGTAQALWHLQVDTIVGNSRLVEAVLKKAQNELDFA